MAPVSADRSSPRSGRSPAAACSPSSASSSARLGCGDGRHRLPRDRAGRQRQRHRASSPCWRSPGAWSRIRREDLRVILLSAGSEESFSEGIKAFGERHFPRCRGRAPSSSALDSIGSPHLLVLRGEGFLKMHEYPPRALGFDGRARRGAGDLALPQPAPAQRHRRPRAAGCRLRDRRACGCTDLKQPANYHWPNDLAENVDFDTLADGVRLTRGRRPPPRRALAVSPSRVGLCTGPS